MTLLEFRFAMPVLERLRSERRHLFLYGPPGVGKRSLLTDLDERDRAEGKKRQTIDLRSTPNFSIPGESCDPETGLTLVNADAPAVQLNDLYPKLSAYSPGTRKPRHSSISEGHPLRVSSVDSVRFAPCLPKKLVQRIERIFRTVRVYPLSFREC